MPVAGRDSSLTGARARVRAQASAKRKRPETKPASPATCQLPILKGRPTGTKCTEAPTRWRPTAPHRSPAGALLHPAPGSGNAARMKPARALSPQSGLLDQGRRKVGDHLVSPPSRRVDRTAGRRGIDQWARKRCRTGLSGSARDAVSKTGQAAKPVRTGPAAGPAEIVALDEIDPNSQEHLRVLASSTCSATVRLPMPFEISTRALTSSRLTGSEARFWTNSPSIFT